MLANLRTLHQTGDAAQHLPRVDGLDDVVVELDSDSLTHRLGLFALCHHHDGDGRVDRPDLPDQIEAPPARHLLVEQHDPVRLSAQQREGIIAVRRRFHLVPMLLEKEHVGPERFDFVVDPEDGFRSCHA